MTDKSFTLIDFSGFKNDESGTLRAAFNTSAGELLLSVSDVMDLLTADPTEDTAPLAAFRQALDTTEAAQNQLEKEFHDADDGVMTAIQALYRDHGHP